MLKRYSHISCLLWICFIPVIFFLSCSDPPAADDPEEHLVVRIFRDRIDGYNTYYGFTTFKANGYAKDKKEANISDIEYIPGDILYSFVYDTERQNFFPDTETLTKPFSVYGVYTVNNNQIVNVKDIGISHLYDPLESNRNENICVNLYAHFDGGAPIPRNPDTDKVFLYMRQLSMNEHILVYEIRIPNKDTNSDGDIWGDGDDVYVSTTEFRLELTAFGYGDDCVLTRKSHIKYSVSFCKSYNYL